MKNSQKQVTEAMFTQNLRGALRSRGLLCPVTPEQVEVFESSKTCKQELPALLADPIAMLDRGYIGPSALTTCSEPPQTSSTRYAARKGVKISDDTWQKMQEDRKKAREQK
jgi:hypothetical protein